MVIRNAQVMDPETGLNEVLDIRIQNGLIEDISDSLPEADEEVIDAKGLVCAPGFIDAHVHFRDPGQTYKEDLYTGSCAAAYGGVTTVMCMPNTIPVLDSVQEIQSIYERSEGLKCRVLPIASVTLGQKGQTLVDFDSLSETGAAAFSDDGHPVPTARLMKNAMQGAWKSKKKVISHCEDLSMGAGAIHLGKVSEDLGLEGVSETAEEIMAAREILLANETRIPVHLAHQSTAASVHMIRLAKQLGVPVSAETCPHYLMLDETELYSQNANFKMNPPLRTKKDVEEVKRGFMDGTIDILVTDHAPHSKEEKALPLDKAPNGIIGLQTSFAATRTALPEMPLMDLIAKMTINPARLFDLPYGRIQKGKPADLVLLDPDYEWIFTEEEICSKSHNSPFIGRKLTGKVRMTILNGKIVYKE